MKIWLMVILVATLAGAATLGATSPDEGFLDSRDGRFLTEMAPLNTMAIALAHAAADQAASPSVRELASRILNDRSRIAAELRYASAQHAVGVVSKMTPYQRITVDWIDATAGATFDREYLEAAQLALGNNIDRFEDEARTGTDPGLRAVATNELPSLRADRIVATTLVGCAETVAVSGGR